MRRVFFVPEGQDINDYKDQWQGLVQEIHTSVSNNNKDYILTDKDAHIFKIPEFQHSVSPDNCSNLDYLLYRVVDDFAEFEDNPSFTLEIWEKDYDNPSKESVKIETHLLNYNKKLELYETQYIRLDAGWYELIYKKNDDIFDTAEISVYFKDVEEEE